MKTYILTILLLSTFSINLLASPLDLGYAREDAGQAGAFLSWGAGARSLGMGRAFVGLADDASATYWNPAGLSQLRRKEIASLYAPLWEETKYSFISYAHPTAKLYAFGVNLVNLQSSDFEETDKFGEIINHSSVDETAVTFSLAYPVVTGLYNGVNIKFVQQRIGNFSDSDIGLDFGMLYKFGELYKLGRIYRIKPLKDLSLGLNLRNIVTPKIILKQDKDVFPLTVDIGVAYKLLNEGLAITLDSEKTTGRSWKTRCGLEYRPYKLIAFRLGINENELGGGLGLDWKDFGFDYALGYHDAIKGINDLGLSHRFSFTMRFGQEYNPEIEVKRRALERYYRRGLKYLRIGEYARAILEFNNILKIEPHYAEALEKMEEASNKLNNIQNK